MVIYVKSPETDAAVRLLARRTGKTLTEAIDDAVREQLRRLDPHDPASLAHSRFDDAVAQLQSWGAGIENPDDLYDEAGLPR